MELAEGCGIWSRPNNSREQRGIRRTWFVSSRIFLGLCDSKVQGSGAVQDFRGSVEVKAGTVSADVGRECVKSVAVPCRICKIKPDGESQCHSFGLTGVVVSLFACREGSGRGSFDLRFRRKQDFKGERQSVFLCSLDQRTQDGSHFWL